MQARVRALSTVALQYREAMASCSSVACPHRHTVLDAGSSFDGVVLGDGFVMMQVNRARDPSEMSNPD
jgi:hypothetical protein